MLCGLNRIRFVIIVLFTTLLVISLLPFRPEQTAAEDFSGVELLRVARIAEGGKDYEGLQFVKAKSQGFVNIAPFGAAGLGTAPAGGAIEVKLNLADYQDKDLRRRLEASPINTAMAAPPTYLVYDGTQGGGMYQGNEFRVSESAASRQWAMMGFAALNKAADGLFPTARMKDEVEGGSKYYVIEVKFTAADTVRYWLDKNFLIYRVVSRYNGKVMIEESRSDYRKVGCLTLPFHVVTKLQGQRLADLDVDSYELATDVPTAKFQITTAQ